MFSEFKLFQLIQSRLAGPNSAIRNLQSKRRIVFISLLLLVCFLPVTTFGRCIEGNCINGQGSYAYPDGSKYVGQFKDYMAHGQGTCAYSNGSKYKGGWRRSKRDGKGTLTHPDGSKYEGEWRDDKRDGTRRRIPILTIQNMKVNGRTVVREMGKGF